MRRSVLDDYREELIALKDKLSITKIADYLYEKYELFICTTSIYDWYKKNNLTKNVKTHN